MLLLCASNVLLWLMGWLVCVWLAVCPLTGKEPALGIDCDSLTSCRLDPEYGSVCSIRTSRI